jgi:dienelactone hydrolase
MKNITLTIVLVCCLLLIDCSTNNSHKQNVQTTEKKDTALVVQKDDITITAADGILLSANYFYNKDKKDNIQPLVVLIHQFRKSKEQWAQNFIDTLVNNGYKVLAYDIRGHGKSSKVKYDLEKLLSDEKEAPSDVDAVFTWAKSQKKSIDSSRIGVMGTSIGGNLACYAGYYLGSKTTIAVSNSKESFESFLRIDPRKMSSLYKRLASVYLICGSKDGDHEKDAKDIMKDYLMDPMELKVYDSDKHGINLIEQNPEIYTLALNWFKKNL